MNKLSTIIAATLAATSKARQGLLENIRIDDSSEGIILYITNAQPVTVSNEGIVQTGPVLPTRTINLSFASELEVILSASIMSIMLDGMRALKTVADGQGNQLELEKANIAYRFINEVLPVATGSIMPESVKQSAPSLEFNFKEFGLDKAMFATGDKSVYTMPNGSGYKVYLIAEYKREFDDLVDNGLLSEEYGRNLVKKGDFTGTYAVLIPCRTSV